MHRFARKFGVGCLGLAALLAVAGCTTSQGTTTTEAGGGVATQADIQALKGQIADLQNQLNSVSQQAANAEAKAEAAQQAADRAAADAQAASQKADMMFKKSLQK